MDGARVAVRMGAKKVSIVYRRTEKECPARKEEIEHAKQEGVEFEFLLAPIRLLPDENGWVSQMECIRMELGEPDASGRRRPVEVKGSEFLVPADTIVTALGFGVNPLVPSTTPGLGLDKWGVIVANKETGETTAPAVLPEAILSLADRRLSLRWVRAVSPRTPFTNIYWPKWDQNRAAL